MDGSNTKKILLIFLFGILLLSGSISQSYYQKVEPNGNSEIQNTIDFMPNIVRVTSQYGIPVNEMVQNVSIITAERCADINNKTTNLRCTPNGAKIVLTRVFEPGEYYTFDIKKDILYNVYSLRVNKIPVEKFEINSREVIRELYTGINLSNTEKNQLIATQMAPSADFKVEYTVEMPGEITNAVVGSTDATINGATTTFEIKKIVDSDPLNVESRELNMSTVNCGGLAIIIFILLIIMKTNGDKKRKELKAINDSKDEGIIKGFALYSKDKDVRLRAVKRLTEIEASQSTWKELSSDAKDRTIRLMAANKLASGVLAPSANALIELACYDKDKIIRLNAVDKLTSDAALKQVVNFAKYNDSKIQVVKRLGEQNNVDGLEYVYSMHRTNPAVRNAANEMLGRISPKYQHNIPIVDVRWLTQQICTVLVVLFILYFLVLPPIVSIYFPSYWDEKHDQLDLQKIFALGNESKNNTISNPNQNIAHPSQNNAQPSQNNGCFYDAAQNNGCSESKMCIDNNCVQLLAMNKNDKCEKSEVNINGVCQTAALSVVFIPSSCEVYGDYSVDEEQQLKDEIIKGVTIFVSQTLLEDCQDDVRIDILSPEGCKDGSFTQNYLSNLALQYDIKVVFDPSQDIAYYSDYVPSDIAEALGLWTQTCYLPSPNNPTPVDFEEGNCKEINDGTCTEYKGETFDPYVCDGNFNSEDGRTIMGWSEYPESPKYGFTDEELAYLDTKLECN